MVAQLANTLSYGQHLLDLSGTPANDYNIGVEIGNASGVPVGQFFVYSASGTGPTTVGQNVAIGTDGQLIEAVHNGVNASLFTNSRISGTNATMNSIANPTSPATRNLNFIGQDANGDSASYFNGQIAEILIYGALIDPTTRQSVEAYLLNKYNLL
jgi:hypothetical protein